MIPPRRAQRVSPSALASLYSTTSTRPKSTATSSSFSQEANERCVPWEDVDEKTIMEGVCQEELVLVLARAAPAVLAALDGGGGADDAVFGVFVLFEINVIIRLNNMDDIVSHFESWSAKLEIK
ncbi:hypothetical protein M440DRAFT_1035334 [Trichoderma longibrachiatum ATCC 18648]|uniref:Uncharacterized protein n=1 Tax=Trichoderma longibrachiatum ATCC 18648 TaxID=983965 RepID=A0A2T4BZP6_TRILO|nr:hypothetical protein M440DRAFT_1035334 [Trichoderma longibrachiatum ATCC 18648]